MEEVDIFLQLEEEEEKEVEEEDDFNAPSTDDRDILKIDVEPNIETP